MIEILSGLYSGVAGFCFVAGALLLAHSHNRKRLIKRLLKNGTKTEGKVVEVNLNPGSIFSKEPGEGYAPVVEYTTSSGNTLRHCSTTYRSPSRYQVGQIVPLWFINYKSNREATLEDDEPGSLPGNLFLAGIILLLIALPKILFSLPGLIGGSFSN